MPSAWMPTSISIRLITMDCDAKTNRRTSKPGKEFGKGPMNMFVNVPEYPPANFRVVVRPNFDTLYSIAWLDLVKEPLVVSVPDTGGVIIFCRCSTCGPTYSRRRAGARPGRRPANFLVAPPGWRPDLRDVSSRSSGCRRTRSASMRRRRSSGSSGEPRRTARRTMTRCTRSRRASRSRRCPSGESRPSRSRSRSTRAST